VWEGDGKGVSHVADFCRWSKRYWISDEPSLKLIPVYAIGVPFYTVPEHNILRASCAKWIQAALTDLRQSHVWIWQAYRFRPLLYSRARSDLDAR
jgi:hypothetical protein